jgi:hypothetical protein
MFVVLRCAIRRFFFVSDPISVHSVGPETILAAAVDWLEAVSCVVVV